jgi:hypothetical protein
MPANKAEVRMTPTTSAIVKGTAMIEPAHGVWARSYATSCR